MPSVPNTFAPPGNRTRDLCSLPDDATHLTIQPPMCVLMSVYRFTSWCCDCGPSVTNKRICYVMISEITSLLAPSSFENRFLQNVQLNCEQSHVNCHARWRKFTVTYSSIWTSAVSIDTSSISSLWYRTKRVWSQCKTFSVKNVNRS